MRPTVLVFLKYPEPGRVKTRLAATIGAERAARLYRDWIGTVFGNLQPIREKLRIIGFFAGGPVDAFSEWHSLADAWWLQPPGDLGQKLDAGFHAAHDSGGPAAAIGTDCLEIGPELVLSAFEELGRHDAVFGPAQDGGYYLVGTARYQSEFFEGIRWSSSETLADQLQRCRELGLTTSLLEPLHDIDSLEDLEAYQRRTGGPEKRAMSGPRAMLAVLIPTFNEEAAVAATLRSLSDQSEPADTVLVIDGGSRDSTAEVARAHKAEVLTAPGGGRGGQVTAGLGLMGDRAEAVLVAHADMIFPSSALQAVRDRLTSDPGCQGGCLGHRFNSPRKIYRLIEWADRRRARRGISYGDQAQFFRPAALARAGGYPNQPIMEDLELSLRLKSLGTPAYLNLPVTVSPRRFERLGLARVLWTNYLFRRAYRKRGLAACQEIFERYYPRPPAHSPAAKRE